uniref:Microtubule-associated protein 1A/B/S-like MBL-like domain-containing protein n=1 Tax=Trichobilharzia regenti TaxID=157069 RepID=A0AA85J2M5_TRIRE|nr:unnamed protein product [Trichobilharzia regenti]
MAHESVLIIGGRIDENSSQEKLSKFLYDGLVAAFGGNLDNLDPLFLECLTKSANPTDTKEYGLTLEYALNENILLRVLFNPTSEQLRFGLQEALTHALGSNDSAVVEYPVTPSTLGKASIVYTGQLLGFTGEWLLQDSSFGGNNLMSWLDGEAAMSWWPHLKKFSNFGDQIKLNIFTPIAGSGTCWPVDKSGRPQTLLTQINARMAKLDINIEAVWRLNGKQLNMQGNLSGFQGLRSFVDDIIHRHPISKILTDTDIPSVGTALDVTRPVIYVFPGYGVTSQSSALFTIQGFTALLNGSYTTQTLPNWWPMVKHLPKLDAALIPDWSASNILTYRFIEEALKSEQNGSQILGEILMPPSMNSSTDGLSDISSGLILSPPTSLSGAHHGTWASSASMSGDSIPPSLVLYSKLGWGELKLQPLSLRCGLLLMWESTVHGIPSQHPLCIAIPSVQPANLNPVQCLTRLMKALCQVPQLSGPPSANRTVSGKSTVKSTVKQAPTRTSLIRSTKPALNTTSTVKETLASKTTNNNNVNGRPASTRNISSSSPLHQKPATTTTTTTSTKSPLTAPTSKKPIHEKTTPDAKHHVNNSHGGGAIDAHQKRPTSSTLLEAKKTTKPFTTSTKQQPSVSELTKPSSRPSTAAKSAATLAKSKPSPTTTTTTAERLAAHSNLVNSTTNNNAAKLHTRKTEPTTHSTSSNKLPVKKSTITGAKSNHHAPPPPPSKPITEEAELIPAGTAESKDEINGISAPVAVGIATAAAAVGVTAAVAATATALPHATQNDTLQSPLNDSLELASVDPLLSGWKGSAEDDDNQEKDVDVQGDHQNLSVIDDKEVLTAEVNKFITDEQILIKDTEQSQPQPEEDIQQESMAPPPPPPTATTTTVGGGTGEEELYKVHKVIQENMMLAEESDEQLNHEYESENEAKQPSSHHEEHESEVEVEQHDGEFKQSYNDSLVDESEDLNANVVVEAEEEVEEEEQHLQHYQQQQQAPLPQEQGSLYACDHDDMRTEETTVPYEKDISPEIESNRVEMMQQYKTPFDDVDPGVEQNQPMEIANDDRSHYIVNNNFVQDENQGGIEAEHDNDHHHHHHLQDDIDDEDEVIIHTSEDPTLEEYQLQQQQQDEEEQLAKHFNVNEHGGNQGYMYTPTSLPVCMIEDNNNNNDNNNVEPQENIIDYNTTENVISREEITVKDNAGSGDDACGDESSFNESYYVANNSYFAHTPLGDTVLYVGEGKDPREREEQSGEVFGEAVEVEEETSYLDQTCVHEEEEEQEEGGVEEQTHPDVAINNNESHLLVTDEMMKPTDSDIDVVSSDIPSHMMTMMTTPTKEEPIAEEEVRASDHPAEPEENGGEHREGDVEVITGNHHVESAVPHSEEEYPFDSNEQEKLLHQVEGQPPQHHQEIEEEEDFENEDGKSDIDEMETEFVIKYQKQPQQEQEHVMPTTTTTHNNNNEDMPINYTHPTSIEEVYPVNQYTNEFEHYSNQPVDYEYTGNVMLPSTQTMNAYPVDSSTDNDQGLRDDYSPSSLCEETKKANDEQQQQHTDMLIVTDESVQKVDSTTHDDSSLLINHEGQKFDDNQIDDIYQPEDNITATTTTTTGLLVDTAETITECQPMCSPDSEVSDDSIIRRPDHHQPPQQQQQLEEQHYKEEEGEAEHDDYMPDDNDEQVQQTSVVNSLVSTPNRSLSPNQNIVSSTHPNDDDDEYDQCGVTSVGKQFNEEEQQQQFQQQPHDELLDYSSLAQQAYSSSMLLNNNTNASMIPTTTSMTTDHGDGDGDDDVNTTMGNCMPSEENLNGIATTTTTTTAAFESQLHADLSASSTSPPPPPHQQHLHQEQHSDVDDLKESLNHSMNITSTTAPTTINNNYPYTNGFNLNGGNANGYSGFEQIPTNNQGLDENHHYNYLYNNSNSSIMNQSEQPNQLLETMIDDHDDGADDDHHITTSELLKSAHLSSSHSPYTSLQMFNNNGDDNDDFTGNDQPVATTPKTPPPSATLSVSSLKELDNLNSSNNTKDYHGDIIDHLMQDPHYANTTMATTATTPTADESIFDPIKQWGQPLGLPAPVPPSTTANHHMKVSHAPNVSAKRIRSADTGGKTTSATGDSNELTLPPGPPVYLDVIWVPNYLIRVPQSMIIDFFTRVRSKMYILSGEALHPNIAEALITAKAKWNPDDVAYLCRCDANSSDAVITILPTYEPKEWIRWLETPCGRLDEQKGSDRLTANHFRLLPAVNLCSTQFNAGDMIFECEGLRVEF